AAAIIGWSVKSSGIAQRPRRTHSLPFALGHSPAQDEPLGAAADAGSARADMARPVAAFAAAQRNLAISDVPQRLSRHENVPNPIGGTILR
ncbi:MAG: hypothetical protein AAFR40_09875, partial [Pseudomonadota bacterium]